MVRHENTVPSVGKTGPLIPRRSIYYIHDHHGIGYRKTLPIMVLGTQFHNTSIMVVYTDPLGYILTLQHTGCRVKGPEVTVRVTCLAAS